LFDAQLDCSEGDCLQRASPSGVKSAKKRNRIQLFVSVGGHVSSFAPFLWGNEENRYAIRCLNAKQDVLLGCEHPICF